MVKRYKPKKWFSYARLFIVFGIIFTLGKTTDHVYYDIIKADNKMEEKALELTVIEENKENIYYEENPVLLKYLSLPEKGFVVTNTNQKYELSDSDFNFLTAVVASESNRFKDDVLAVVSVILNRSDSKGISPVDVVKSPGQFSGYLDGYYLRYLNADGSLTSNTAMVQDVLRDALNGVRNNNYFSFRSWSSSSYSDTYIQEYGNRYR